MEANAQDTSTFAVPAQFTNPARAGHIEKVPSISERNIKAIYPFPMQDGSWGCAFQLDFQGRTALEVISTERRGTSLAVFIVSKAGPRQVIDMLVDKPVLDGIITIQRGLTPEEIVDMKTRYPTVGAQKKKR